MAAFLPAALCFSQDSADQGLRAEAVEAARRALDHMAERQRDGGGWAMAWAVGGEVTFGEHRDVPDTWLTVQPPATPGIGRVFVRAARVLAEPRYMAVAAGARDAMLALQTDAGGFPHEDDPAAPRNRPGTFDDHVTTGALQFLVDYWQATGDEADRAPVLRVGAFLLAAQYPNGGFPQAHPPREDHYQQYITFNDNVMRNAVEALLQLHEILDDPRYRAAAIRAGECMIALQGGPGEAIWAQQYDPDTLEPAWARNFEPPGYTPNESRGVCDTLIRLYVETGDGRFLESVGRALEWYGDHRGDDGLYARLYEPGTGRAVYGRRDKAVKVYDYAEATDGYAWRGDWYPHAAERAYTRIREVGRAAYVKERAEAAGERAAPDRDTVEEIIDALHPEGYWVEEPGDAIRGILEERGVAENRRVWVHSRLFVRNMNGLLDAIAAISDP